MNFCLSFSSRWVSIVWTVWLDEFQLKLWKLILPIWLLIWEICVAVKKILGTGPGVDVNGDETIDFVNVMREDNKIYENTREELMSNAPDIEGEFFKVPKIN